MDTENKGYLVADDFTSYFKDYNLIDNDFNTIIFYWNGSKRDERLML